MWVRSAALLLKKYMFSFPQSHCAGGIFFQPAAKNKAGQCALQPWEKGAITVLFRQKRIVRSRSAAAGERAAVPTATAPAAAETPGASSRTPTAAGTPSAAEVPQTVWRGHAGAAALPPQKAPHNLRRRPFVRTVGQPLPTDRKKSPRRPGFFARLRELAIWMDEQESG